MLKYVRAAAPAWTTKKGHEHTGRAASDRTRMIKASHEQGRAITLRIPSDTSKIELKHLMAEKLAIRDGP
jgi:hypothetical protein